MRFGKWLSKIEITLEIWNKHDKIKKRLKDK
jgi:hypothetical protein